MVRECQECGIEYDPRAKRGGLFTTCPDCSRETTSRVRGTMHFDHKTAPTIEITRASGELLRAAPIGERRRS